MDEPVGLEEFERDLKEKGFIRLWPTRRQNLETMDREREVRFWAMAYMCGHCPDTHLAIVAITEDGGVAYESVLDIKEAEALANQLLNPRPARPGEVDHP